MSNSCDSTLSKKNTSTAITPYTTTSKVNNKTRDCTLWVHPLAPELSWIIGCNQNKDEALYAWDLQGKQIFSLPLHESPQYLDIRYQQKLHNKQTDIIACSFENSPHLLLFSIDVHSNGLYQISDLIDTGLKTPIANFCLYQHPKTKRLSAFVTDEEGKSLHQIILKENKQGQIEGQTPKIISINNSDQRILKICCDDENKQLYATTSQGYILKIPIDSPQNYSISLPIPNLDNSYHICLYKEKEQEGHLILSSPHHHSIDLYSTESSFQYLGSFQIQTHGVFQTKATAKNLGPHFPQGGLVCQNSSLMNYSLYDWRSIELSLQNQQKLPPQPYVAKK